ncbi:TetR/AcrR family transcriptional regulator [Alcanivorax sp. 1008]|uniref:TetR/AcrR family transcriptional regulator n=1 Tax=Alcanivorax sp. 1008 TaxID=2816853 RepID=UPI001DD6283A|nr:TetR/AcrR family transcriptional regulator [Alcanivorax sp. 1008]MCC1498018.1 TetR/AcrR family transcriptional regulator [Alcanivorax sp. 1008]
MKKPHPPRRQTEGSPVLTLTGQAPADKNDSTSDLVLDSALSLFIEFGLRRTTMEDVALQAGIGRATLYRRFGDKDQLVQAVILRECQQQLALIEQRLDGQRSAVDSLIEAFVLAVTRAHVHPLLIRLLSSEAESILPYLTTRLPQVTTFARLYLAAQLSKSQQQGHMAKLPAEQTAELLLRLLQSLVLSPDGVIDPSSEASVRDFANTFLRPLLTPAV